MSVLHLSYLPLLEGISEFSPTATYVNKLPLTSIAIKKETITSPYTDDKYIASKWRRLCQEIVGFIYTRSLGEQAQNFAYAKVLSSHISEMLRELMRGPYKTTKLRVILSQAKEMFADLIISECEDELSRPSLYFANTKTLIDLLWTLLGYPEVLYLKNMLIIGNYAIVEEGNRKTRLYPMHIDARHIHKNFFNPNVKHRRQFSMRGPDITYMPVFANREYFLENKIMGRWGTNLPEEC